MYLAARTAPVTTFEPVFSNFTISACGIVCDINSESSTSSGCGKENNIPFVNKCISIATPELKKENGDTRWEYIDAEREHPLPWYTPVLIIEDTEGNLTYIPSVKDKSLYDTGTSFENPEEVVETLKPYLI